MMTRTKQKIEQMTNEDRGHKLIIGRIFHSRIREFNYKCEGGKGEIIFIGKQGTSVINYDIVKELDHMLLEV